MKVGHVDYGSERICYEVEAVTGRRTLGIEVYPDLRVLVRAPADCKPEVIAERVRRRAAWISRQLADFDRYRPRTPPRRFVSGEAHRYLGRQFRLAIVGTEGPRTVRLHRGRIEVHVSIPARPAQVRDAVRYWYRERARQRFGEVLDAQLRCFTGMERPRLAIRTMASRWGSLSAAGTMTLNVRLIEAPLACIEYVIVHELCHRRHRNHDARFFRTLDRMLPDWRQRKARLESALL
jgi:hypothetical protein